MLWKNTWIIWYILDLESVKFYRDLHFTKKCCGVKFNFNTTKLKLCTLLFPLKVKWPAPPNWYTCTYYEVTWCTFYLRLTTYALFWKSFIFFEIGQLKEIEKVSLAMFICRNFQTIEKVQTNPMCVHDSYTKYVWVQCSRKYYFVFYYNMIILINRKSFVRISLFYHFIIIHFGLNYKLFKKQNSLYQWNVFLFTQPLYILQGLNWWYRPWTLERGPTIKDMTMTRQTYNKEAMDTTMNSILFNHVHLHYVTII